jgi:hypothetical protein
MGQGMVRVARTRDEMVIPSRRNESGHHPRPTKFMPPKPVSTPVGHFQLGLGVLTEKPGWWRAAVTKATKRCGRRHQFCKQEEP